MVVEPIQSVHYPLLSGDEGRKQLYSGGLLAGRGRLLRAQEIRLLAGFDGGGGVGSAALSLPCSSPAVTMT